jgi:hypothetical protein
MNPTPTRKGVRRGLGRTLPAKRHALGSDVLQRGESRSTPSPVPPFPLFPFFGSKVPKEGGGLPPLGNFAAKGGKEGKEGNWGTGDERLPGWVPWGEEQSENVPYEEGY